jgi:hypothetical protein
MMTRNLMFFHFVCDAQIAQGEGFYCGRKSGGGLAGAEAAVPSVCEDDADYKFGKYTLEGVKTTRTCDWITANEEKESRRKSRWCEKTKNGEIVKEKCPVACDLCPIAAAAACPEGTKDAAAFAFGTYEDDGVTTERTCAWITANENKTAKRQNAWCGESYSGKSISYKCPVACGECVLAEEAEEVPTGTCTLEATLAHPFDTPDDAPYYGYHAEYLEVTMASDDYYECSWSYSDDLPNWCTYSSNGDSAYVANFDDDWVADDTWEELTSEEVTVYATPGETYNFKVQTWFFDEDYYTSYETWNDHMMAAVLKIKNKSSDNQNQLKSSGWSHPVDVDVSTHIQVNGEWVVNPDYQGSFLVTATCDDDCLCESTYTLI